MQLFMYVYIYADVDVENESGLGIAYDSDLLHALLNDVELISYCIRISNISKMRYDIYIC
jgi:hypothetical protein